ncbi:MAG: hypothetical protein JW816_03315 [Candidatus Buchananbacteria bacterium]|nr:hypothetical protein [Candidatus Buchananbacteria bacterium]
MMIDFSVIKKLNLPVGTFAIFGSGPMAVRGIRESHDIDLIVRTSVWNDLSARHEVIGENKNLIKIGNIEIWKDRVNLSDKIDEMIDNAEIINDLPFVKLSYLLEWKKFMNRDKDKKDIILIKQYLNN